jgi:hypothetical protein
MASTPESSDSVKGHESTIDTRDDNLDVAARLAAGGQGEISPEDALRLRYVACTLRDRHSLKLLKVEN